MYNIKPMPTNAAVEKLCLNLAAQLFDLVIAIGTVWEHPTPERWPAEMALEAIVEQRRIADFYAAHPCWDDEGL